MDDDTRAPTIELSRVELAEVLGVKPNTLSGAAHERYLCQGYPVSEWAVPHPRGNEIMKYEVPLQVVEEEKTGGIDMRETSPP